MEYILIFITAIFVNNIVLSQFLGICPFLGVSKKVETATGMGAAVAFVLTIATIVTYLIQKFVLDAFGLEYLQTIAFILVIAALDFHPDMRQCRSRAKTRTTQVSRTRRTKTDSDYELYS